MSDSYICAPSVRSGTVTYKTTDTDLVIETESANDREAIPFSDVSTIRLTLFQGQGLCTILTRNGKKKVITSKHCKGFDDFEDRSESYKSFISTLHQKLKDSGAQPRLIAGTNFGFLLGLLGCVVGAGALLATVASLLRGVLHLRMLFGTLMGFGLIAATLPWLTVARRYTYDDLPERHLPG